MIMEISTLTDEATIDAAHYDYKNRRLTVIGKHVPEQTIEPYDIENWHTVLDKNGVPILDIQLWDEREDNDSEDYGLQYATLEIQVDEYDGRRWPQISPKDYHSAISILGLPPVEWYENNDIVRKEEPIEPDDFITAESQPFEKIFRSLVSYIEDSAGTGTLEAFDIEQSWRTVRDDYATAVTELMLRRKYGGDFEMSHMYRRTDDSSDGYTLTEEAQDIYNDHYA